MPNQMVAENKKTFIRGCVITAIALVGSITIGTSVIGGVLGRYTLDHFIRTDKAFDEGRIVLIDITENDYHELFKQQRPLNPAIIMQLITAAIDGGAKLVAVDISTNDWPKEWQKSAPDLPDGAIVWARGFYLQQQERPRYEMESLLGGAEGSEQQCYGVPAFADEAGVLRSFYTGLKIRDHSDQSFISQIVYRSTNESCLTEDKDDGKLLIINFSAHIRKESASTLLKEFNDKSWKVRGEFTDKVVILGGSFHSGSDMRETPVGIMSGLEINGQAVSALMRNGTRTELPEFWSILVDLLIGVILIAVGLYGRVWQLAAATVALALSVYLSLYLYRQYYLFVSFLPIVAGIFAHSFLEWIDHRGDSRADKPSPQIEVPQTPNPVLQQK